MSGERHRRNVLPRTAAASVSHPMRPLPALLTLALTCALPALAQSDEPIPYDDDGSARRAPGPDATPQPYAEPGSRPRTDTALEQSDADVSLARFDDPAKGLGAELMGGVLLLDSSRGAGTDKHAGFGARLTWDFGRLLADDVLHEGLFADVVWLHGSEKDGTADVFDSTRLDYLTVAPAFELPFSHGSPFGIYGQLGVGASLVSSTVTVLNTPGSSAGTETSVSGLKPVFQYGIGLRGRPLVSRDGLMRLAFRVELTRFRRGYLNDTYLGASLGLAY